MEEKKIGLGMEGVFILRRASVESAHRSHQEMLCIDIIHLASGHLLVA